MSEAPIEARIHFRPFAGLLAAAFLAVALPAAGEEIATGSGARRAGEEMAAGEGALQVAGEARADRIWGSAYYQGVGEDAFASSPPSLGISQEAGLSLSLRGGLGLELLSDFVLPLNPDLDLSPNAVIQQLYVRVSPLPAVTLTAGKQRLNWGTAKVFSAIDTLEVRANPLDVRSVLSGVSGLKAEILPTGWFGASLVVLPGSTLRWSRLAGRLDLVAEDLGLDFGVGAVKYAYLDRRVPDGGDPAPLDRVAFLSDAAWSRGPLVLYEEVQLRWGRQAGYLLPGMAAFDDLGGGDAMVFRGVGGMMLQLDLGLARPTIFLLEYLYNGDGLSTAEARSFSSRYAAWLNAGQPAGVEAPAAFQGIGGFRRHYLSAAVQNIALNRSLLVSASEILGIDSLFSRSEVSLEWYPTQAICVTLSYELYHAFLEVPDQPTELLLIPFRNRAVLSVSTSFG